MEIKVLGMGCANCRKLLENAKTAAAKVPGATVEKVEDMARIAGYGVMRTPALVIDGKAVSQGRILNADEILRLIAK
jgi:small redox-active disulfide protein 2